MTRDFLLGILTGILTCCAFALAVLWQMFKGVI